MDKVAGNAVFLLSNNEANISKHKELCGTNPEISNLGYFEEAIEPQLFEKCKEAIKEEGIYYIFFIAEVQNIYCYDTKILQTELNFIEILINKIG